jgi:hypothetical protein
LHELPQSDHRRQSRHQLRQPQPGVHKQQSDRPIACRPVTNNGTKSAAKRGWGFDRAIYRARVPVEFLSDAEAAAYGRFDRSLTREDLDRAFFLDDADRELIGKRRGAPNRLGFALQLTTARWLGTFLPYPTDVPPEVLQYVASQLEVGDPSVVRRYLERRRTRFEHAEEIKAFEGLRDFAAVRGELEEWAAARAYMTGDGPRAIFTDAVGWLREQRVLLPGVTTLARLVARGRAEGDRRLWETLASVPSEAELRELDAFLDVAEGSRMSELERARKGPADPTGKNLRLLLARVKDLHRLGVDGESVRALVPTRRLMDLARYGLQATAPQLRRHPPARRTADAGGDGRASAGSLDRRLP